MIGCFGISAEDCCFIIKPDIILINIKMKIIKLLIFYTSALIYDFFQAEELSKIGQQKVYAFNIRKKNRKQIKIDVESQVREIYGLNFLLKSKFWKDDSLPWYLTPQV